MQPNQQVMLAVAAGCEWHPCSRQWLTSMLACLGCVMTGWRSTSGDQHCKLQLQGASHRFYSAEGPKYLWARQQQRCPYFSAGAMASQATCSTCT